MGEISFSTFLVLVLLGVAAFKVLQVIIKWVKYWPVWNRAGKSSGEQRVESPVKVCKYCQSTIDKKAKICPFCRKRQPVSPGAALFWGLLCFASLIVIFSNAAENREAKMAANQVTQENYDSLESGMTYDEVCEVFGKKGRGHYSVSASLGDISSTLDYYYWYAPDGSFALICFDEAGEMVMGSSVNLK